MALRLEVLRKLCHVEPQTTATAIQANHLTPACVQPVFLISSSSMQLMLLDWTLPSVSRAVFCHRTRQSWMRPRLTRSRTSMEIVVPYSKSQWKQTRIVFRLCPISQSVREMTRATGLSCIQVHVTVCTGRKWREMCYAVWCVATADRGGWEQVRVSCSVIVRGAMYEDYWPRYNRYRHESSFAAGLLRVTVHSNFLILYWLTQLFIVIWKHKINLTLKFYWSIIYLFKCAIPFYLFPSSSLVIELSDIKFSIMETCNPVNREVTNLSVYVIVKSRVITIRL